MEMRLPEKLSDCLELALADMAKCERSPKYEVDLTAAFYLPLGDGTCSVCAAGAVMVKTLGESRDMEVFPDHFRPWNEARLNALDAVRFGDVALALDYLGLWQADYRDLDRDVASYDRGERPQWKRDMRKIIRDLRKEGL